MSFLGANEAPRPAGGWPTRITFLFQQNGHLPSTAPSSYSAVFFGATAFLPRKNPKAKDSRIKILKRLVFPLAMRASFSTDIDSRN